MCVIYLFHGDTDNKTICNCFISRVLEYNNHNNPHGTFRMNANKFVLGVCMLCVIDIFMPVGLRSNKKIYVVCTRPKRAKKKYIYKGIEEEELNREIKIGCLSKCTPHLGGIRQIYKQPHGMRRHRTQYYSALFCKPLSLYLCGCHDIATSRTVFLTFSVKR